MRSIHFNLQGFSRSYWNLYVGLGLFVSVFLLFAAVLAWEMGGFPAEALARMRGVAWAFACCFAVLTILSWRYFFTAPLAFSILITACLIAAGWRSPKIV
jgi:hypothetical protein